MPLAFSALGVSSRISAQLPRQVPRAVFSAANHGLISSPPYRRIRTPNPHRHSAYGEKARSIGPGRWRGFDGVEPLS